MHEFLKIIGPKRELQHVDESPSTLSHGVNKAHDTKLKQTIALNFLSPERPDDNIKGQILLLLLVVFTLTGCNYNSTESINEPINHSPEIVSLTATPSTIVAPDISGLDVKATDADSDELTYAWSAEHGEIVPSLNPTTATWFSGNVARGDYAVTCSVSDGKDTTTRSVTITVL